jgi:hypothetical protein
MLESRWLASAEAAAHATRDGEILATIRARPGFRALLLPWAANWRVREDDSAMLARALHDLGRYMAGMFALQLHFTPGGLTLTRLAEALTLSGLAGAGRARTSLIYMRLIGYIEPAPDRDGRTRRFRPTDRMLAAFKTRLLRDASAFWPVDPAILAVAPRLSKDEVLGAYMVALGELTALALSDYRPEGASLDVISHRFGGFAVLAELLLTEDDGQPLPLSHPRAYSLSALARACHISRAQARSVFTAAENAGFIEALPDGHCRLTPLLEEHLELLMAGTVLIVAFAARQAMAWVEAQTGEGAVVL